jgi:hypothetical protein
MLLGASFVWAHHWGFLADALVAGWAVATLGALVLSIRALWLKDSSRLAQRLAMIGLAGGIVSVAALVLVRRALGRRDQPHRRLRRRLIVPAIPAERLASETASKGMT